MFLPGVVSAAFQKSLTGNYWKVCRTDEEPKALTSSLNSVSETRGW